jgi:transposase
MVESIIHAVDQYQSQASGADIRYKVGQKVKNGGTVGQAKLGYRNVREPKPEGGEVRTIAVDKERGPLLTQAFELFGTGQYTGRHVLDRLTTAGLTTRPTRKRPAKPLSLSQLYNILSDRYYLGYVEHHGEEYPGRHTPLVTPELFERVQRVLELLRRYSNRPDLIGPLVSAMKKIHNPTDNCNETVTTVNGRTASPHYTRTVLTEAQLAELIDAYRSGTTAKVLAERYDVHITTIKKKLRRYGVTKRAGKG